ncbi:Early nodulin-like protein 1 [Zostera marina]|uniref:Early nodulin-like protein 1 n=1 Tax=Zostera marina TaxID=29655 RepID=A0A0K9Q2J3_ZOSMR|nr:Early nodulin-like protein 1 [Zostera marina]
MKNTTGMFLVLLCLCLTFTSSVSREFDVGGKSGWDLESSQTYPQWSSRSRFQLNDTLVFNYTKKGESILDVNNDHFVSCDTNNPIETLEGGHSVFLLNQSGPFYFISGDSDLCKKGLKLNITVMGVHPPKIHPPPIAPGPVQPPAAQPPNKPNTNAAVKEMRAGTPLAVVGAVAMMLIVNSIWV